MTELLVQHKELSTNLCDRLTTKVLELVSEKEPVRWGIVIRDIAKDSEPSIHQAVHTAIWHAVKNGLVVADNNDFLRLPPESHETIETAPNY